MDKSGIIYIICKIEEIQSLRTRIPKCLEVEEFQKNQKWS